jgi:hypothetical protein
MREMNKIFTVAINPGSGPIEGAGLEDAQTNIDHFITDSKLSGVNVVRVPERDEEGRYGFLLWKDTRCHLVEMPGLPLHQVRFMSRDQNPWDFPRLYVDESSWLWEFALLESKDFEETDAE